jgi:gamma-F420-2:alpha-L-glutamate ligase
MLVRFPDGQAYALNPEIERLALPSAKALNLDVAGVDLLFDVDSYSVCGVTSSLGFECFEAATGLNVARTLLQLCRDRSGWSKTMPG